MPESSESLSMTSSGSLGSVAISGWSGSTWMFTPWRACFNLSRVTHFVLLATNISYTGWQHLDISEGPNHFKTNYFDLLRWARTYPAPQTPFFIRVVHIRSKIILNKFIPVFSEPICSRIIICSPVFFHTEHFH